MEDLMSAPSAGHGGLIKDATIETFAEDVMAASRETPVIVDFWATWCGPCKTLGPVLEKAVTEMQGQVKMVKVDIDQNQMLAQQLRIQSVPTVMAFIGGQPVDGFAGALPESQIKEFLTRVVQMASQAGLAGGATMGPSAEEMLTVGEEALTANDLGTAAQAFAQVAETSEEDTEEKAKALAGLAKCHMASDNFDEAEKMLAIISEKHANLEAVISANAALELSRSSGDAGEIAAMRAAAEAAPADMTAQFTYAEALIGNNQTEEGVEILLKMIAADREWNEEAARKKLVTLFEALGHTHPVTKDARRRLSSLLFS